MENRLSRTIYNHSPVFLQNLMSSFYGFSKNRMRFSKNYEKWVAYFTKTHQYSDSELLNLQEEKLKIIIKHCYETVPYYKELFDKLGLCPNDIKKLEDLSKLPIMDKETVRAAGKRLISDKYLAEKLFVYPTSGSTGTPLTLYWSQDMLNMETAFVWSRYRNGVKFGDPWSSFAGLEIVSPDINKPPFWRENWAANQRMYSIFHLNERTLPFYYKSLCESYNKFYAGYASFMDIIAEYMIRHNLKLDKPPVAVFSASEELQDVHKERIEKAFDTKVWNRYGQGELVASITEYYCGHLHYDMDYSIIEFIPVGNEGEFQKCEIIGTHLHHHAWPLLRYRTGDIVLINNCNSMKCRVPGIIVQRIWGRTGKYFILPDGTKVCNISVIAKKCKNMRYMQVVQRELGSIVVRVMPSNDYSEIDEKNIELQFRKKVGEQIKISFEYVDDIKRMKSGKYLSIINEIDGLG